MESMRWGSVICRASWSELMPTSPFIKLSSQKLKGLARSGSQTSISISALVFSSTIGGTAEAGTTRAAMMPFVRELTP